MALAGCFSPSSYLTRNYNNLFTIFTKTPSLFFFHYGTTQSHRNLLKHPSLLPLKSTKKPIIPTYLSRRKSSNLSTLPVSSTIPTKDIPVTLSNKAKKRAYRESPEGLLRKKLDMCSKDGDLIEALRLYDDARGKGVQLSLHHYNVLLYLCSSFNSNNDNNDNNGLVDSNCDETGAERGGNIGLKRGFEIFQQMGVDGIAPNEATFTSAARLAARMEDPEMAFDLVKKMRNFDIVPRLRSYGPALFGFCKKGEADKAYEVDAHMADSGVLAEEPELAALLQLSVDKAREEKVYRILHRLRESVRQVSESTAAIVENWFKCDESAKIGKENWDVSTVKEGVVKGGGGWHGEGWLGKGKWKVARTKMDETGVCGTCGEKLVSIDINPLETENFASSLSNLACQREVKASFNEFQEWLHHHGPFDAVIDGANVGMVNSHNFNFFQLNSVVNRVREMSPSKKLPLVILHTSRVHGGPAQNPKNKKLLDTWRNSGALYATPVGSNDDWYWLYAAVSSKCLLITNDEMRDHLFQLLGTSFFPRWKEKHQVRLSVSKEGLTFHMPPPYSIVIQESEGGSWHVPTVVGDDIATPRQWLCATRASSTTLSKPKSKVRVRRRTQ